MNFPTLNDEKTGKWLKLALFCVLTLFCLFGIYFAVHRIKQPSDEPVRMRLSDTTGKKSGRTGAVSTVSVVTAKDIRTPSRVVKRFI